MKRTSRNQTAIRRAILTGSILQVALTPVFAADVILGPDLNRNSDAAPAFYGEGLLEGYINNTGWLTDAYTLTGSNGAKDRVRMGETNNKSGGVNFWSDNQEWIYTGQFFDADGSFTFAENIDDNVLVRIDGVQVLNDTNWNGVTRTTNGGANNGNNYGAGPNGDGWHNIEIRLFNGGGGAGTVDQNGFGGGDNNSYNSKGFGLNIAGTTSTNGADYILPIETLNGTPELFRYQAGNAFTDDLVVRTSATFSISGNAQLAEPSLRFENAAPSTLTITETGAHKTLSISNATQWATATSNGAAVTLDGATDIRPLGLQTDNGKAVTVTRNGTGKLILNTLNGSTSVNNTTFAAGSGTIEVSGATTPVPGATFAVTGNAGVLSFGGVGTVGSTATISNNITASASGTVLHSGPGYDTLTGSTTVAAGQSLGFNVSGGTLVINGAVSGGGITKTGNNTLLINSAPTLDSITANGGTAVINGALTLASSPTLTSGKISLRNGANVLPSALTVTGAGNLEAAAGALPSTSVALTNGNLTLGVPGLVAQIYGNDDGGANANFGNFASYDTYLNGRGGLETTALTSDGGVTSLVFNATEDQYRAFGNYRINNIVSRFKGSIYIPKDGTYNFGTTSDDGSMIFIDGNTVVDNNFYQGATRREGNVFLTKGAHPIDIGFYEGGGGNSMTVDWTIPGNARQNLANSFLTQGATLPTFTNQIDVTGNSSITAGFANVIATDLNSNAASTLTVNGAQLTATQLDLVGGGAHTFNVASGATLQANAVSDGGSAVSVVKSGTGLFILNSPSSPQFQTAGSNISVQAGSLGLVLGGANSPTGNAGISFNGGGVVVSSTGGDQSFPIPSVLNGNPSFEARQIGDGAAGTVGTPINVNFTGSLNTSPGQIVTLGTADNYVISLGGSSNAGGGTVKVNGGTVKTTSGTALDGMHLLLDPGSNPGAAATVEITGGGTAPTALSLSSAGTGTSTLRLTGTNLNINQSTNTTFGGVLAGNGNLVKTGAGTLTLTGTSSTITGSLTINGGAISGTGTSIGSGPITLGNGTLTITVPSGLLGNYYDTNGWNPNANAVLGGDETNLVNGFGSHVPSIANLLSTTNGRTNLKFSDGPGLDGGGPDTATYADQGFNNVNNFSAYFRGFLNITAATAGNYTFTTRSDDGTVVFIDGIKVVNNNFDQGMTNRSGTITLAAGLHSIKLAHYEGGGGSGAEFRFTPPGGADQFIPNSVLLPDNTPVTLNNPITVSGSTATLNSPLVGLVSTTMTMNTASTLNSSGGQLQVNSLTLNGAGAYSFNPGADATITVKQITDSGATVTINKQGGGLLFLDEPTTPQLQSVGSTVNIQGGTLGIPLGGTGNSATGNATITFAANTGIALTSKNTAVAQNYTLPPLAGSASITARQIGSGLAGPATINANGNLAVTAGNTLTTGTADGYTLNFSGTGSGGGNVVVNGGNVGVTSANAFATLNVKLNPTSPATVNFSTNNPSIASIGTDTPGAGTKTVTVGTGSGAATLTLNNTGDNAFDGTIGANPGNTLDIVKNGAGTQRLTGSSNGVGAFNLNGGTLELSQSSLGSGPINVGSGTTLQFNNQGLNLRIYDSNPNNTGAYGALTTIGGVLSHYQSIGTPVISTLTSANGNNFISYNPDGDGDAPFIIHGGASVDNIEAIFSGKINIPTAGVWNFATASDDGTTLFIDGNLIVNNNFAQGVTSRNANVTLSAGAHSIVITFNEGGGGAGMFVNYTAPGGSSTLLSNALLSSPDTAASNPVNILGSATINANGGSVSLGNATQAGGATLTTGGGGQLQFSQTTISSGNTLNYSVAPNTTVIPGALLGAVSTVNVAGGGSVVLGGNNAQLAGGAINVNASTLTAKPEAGGLNPLGTSVITLNNNSVLRLTTGGGDQTFGNSIVTNGSTTIQAGTFGIGATGTPNMTLTGAVNVPGTLNAGAQDGYKLTFGGNVTASGPLNISGDVRTNAALNVASINLAANGTLQTVGPVTVTGPTTVPAGSTLGFNGNSYSGGTVNVNGTVEFNGASASPIPLSIDGGRVNVASGAVDFGTSTLTATAPSTNRTGGILSAKAYHLVNPPGGYGTDAGLSATLNATPVASTNLTGDLNFGPRFGADGAFNTFFGTTLNDAFTATFTGNFTAAATGAFTFGHSINDDSASIWVDLNRNGLFETGGSAGNELIKNQIGCCGPSDDANDTANGTAQLVAGQTYKVAFVVEDTGGGSSLGAKWAPGNIPSGVNSLANFVNPGAQAGVWSVDAPTGGGRLRIGPDASFRAAGTSNITELELAGGGIPGITDGAKLTLNSATESSSSIGLIRTSAGGASTLDLGANNTLNVDNFAIQPGAYIYKAGAGNLNINALSLGSGSTLAINGGIVTQTGSALASDGTNAANSGNVDVNDGGTFVANGRIPGFINIYNHGMLKGTGFVGPVTVNLGGIIAPGNSPGTLNTGTLTLNDDSIFQAELDSSVLFDRINVAGAVTLSTGGTGTGSILSLSLPTGLFAATAGDKFQLIVNDGIDLVSGTFAGLPEGATINILSSSNTPIESFTVSYAENFDGGAVGNDVGLTFVVPEPASATMLLGGIATLLGIRRRRR